MIIARKAWLLVGLLLVSASSSTVEAQDYNGLGFAYMYGYGATNLPYIQSYVPAPPYFSLHPPVYYGKRYNRPFGDSPFASWPQLQAASTYRPRPAVPSAPMNVPSPDAACPTCQPTNSTPLAQSAIKPLIVENPFYNPVSQTRLAQHGVTAPKSEATAAP